MPATWRRIALSHWNASQKGFVPPDSQRRMKAATPGIYMKNMITVRENHEVEAIPLFRFRKIIKRRPLIAVRVRLAFTPHIQSLIVFAYISVFGYNVFGEILFFAYIIHCKSLTTISIIVRSNHTLPERRLRIHKDSQTI